MATFSDWQDRHSRLLDSITQVQNLVESYVKNNRSTNELVLAVDSLKKKKAILESKEKDYEQEAATADRDFLERKSGFPDPFYPDKLYTVQDFIFFFFFISYIILTVALILTFRQKFGTILGVSVVLLLLSCALIFRYA